MPLIVVDGRPVHVRVAKGRKITDRDREAVAECVRAMNKAQADSMVGVPEGKYAHETYGAASVELK